MIVTFHQPNFAPGWSVLSKVLAADAVVWMDTVQFTKGGFTNRNKLPDKSWATVPVADATFSPINRVRIGEPQREWRAPLIHSLIEAWPGDITAAVCHQILRSYPLLVGLNAAILNILLDAFEFKGEQHWQSHLDEAHSVPAESKEKGHLRPISWRIAEMVAAIGGTSYLSGPSGRNYLDEEPFDELGIEVDYWHHEGPNPCALALVGQRVEVAA